MKFTCIIEKYDMLNKICLKEQPSNLEIVFLFNWENGRKKVEKCNIRFICLELDFHGVATYDEKRKVPYMIVLNSSLSEEEQHHTLKHEVEHIAYRDFDNENGLSVGEIETIRHSAIGGMIKREYKSIDSMKKGA